MSTMGIVIRVHSGPDVVHTIAKPVAESNSLLVQSLKEAKAEVNQYLTELVVKSGNQEQTLGVDDACDDEQDEDDDDDDDNAGEEDKQTSLKGSLNSKRKLGSNIEAANGSKLKRAD